MNIYKQIYIGFCLIIIFGIMLLPIGIGIRIIISGIIGIMETLFYLFLSLISDTFE